MPSVLSGGSSAPQCQGGGRAGEQDPIEPPSVEPELSAESPPKKPRKVAQSSQNSPNSQNEDNVKDPKDDKSKGNKGTKTDAKTKELAKLATAAGKVRIKFHAISGSAATLLQTIKTDSKWRWANNDSMRKPLQSAVDVLKQADTPFSRVFLSESLQVVKKQYPKEDELIK